MSQIKQPAIQVVANEINSIDTESNIPAIKAMVDLDSLYWKRNMIK